MMATNEKKKNSDEERKSIKNKLGNLILFKNIKSLTYSKISYFK